MKDREQEWWDVWFLGLAEYISGASKDPSTRTGAVIVRPDRTIASIGYNGFPRGIKDDERLNDRDTKYSLIVHCEMNAILNAKESLKGYTLYTYPFCSCDRCAVHVIQSGITRCVAPYLPVELMNRWIQSITLTKKYFDEANIELINYHL